MEYVRVADASFRVFGFIAIFAFLFRIDIARGFLLISLPLGILVLVLERWLWRQWLRAQRLMGEYSARVLLIGSQQSVAQIARELQRSPGSGYLVVGACIPEGHVGGTIQGTDIPVMGRVDAIERAMSATGADTVAVTSTDDLSPDKVKQISWGLGGRSAASSPRAEHRRYCRTPHTYPTGLGSARSSTLRRHASRQVSVSQSGLSICSPPSSSPCCCRRILRGRDPRQEFKPGSPLLKQSGSA